VREDDDLEPIETEPPPEKPPVGERRSRWPAVVVASLLAAVVGGAVGASAVKWTSADEHQVTQEHLRDLSTRVRQITPSNKVTVPNVSGLTRREAEAILSVAGLQPLGDATYPPPGPTVLDQQPAAGTVVDRGAGVQLHVRPGEVVVTGPVEATGTAMDLIRLTGCEGAENLADAESEPGRPRSRTAAECRFGDANFSIHTYDGEADVTAVLEADGAFCGHRAVGRSWIATVNTEQTAWRIQNALGGRVVRFAGC
jgi:hypothetical protein